jgi:hypothetical protein
MASEELLHAGECDSSSGSDSEPSFDNLEAKSLKKVVPVIEPREIAPAPKKVVKRKLIKSESTKITMKRKISSAATDGSTPKLAPVVLEPKPLTSSRPK